MPLHRVCGPVQFWAALAAGRTIALMRAFDPAVALAAIGQRRITHWSALPETFLELRRLGEAAVRAANVSSLQELVVGAAATPWPLKTWLADVFGPIVGEA